MKPDMCIALSDYCQNGNIDMASLCSNNKGLQKVSLAIDLQYCKNKSSRQCSID